MVIIRLLMLFLTLIVLAACGEEAADKPQQAEEPPYPKLVTAYLEKRFELNPTVGVAAGRHEYDGLIADFSPAGFKARVEFYRESRAKFMAIDATALSTTQQFERELVLFDINRGLYYIEDERRPFTNIAYYRGRLSPDTYVDRNYAPKAVRLQALVDWAQNVTPAISQVRANLEVPMPATFVELAIGYFRGMAVFLRRDVPPIFADIDDPAAQIKLSEALRKAAVAFDDAGAWAETLRTTATDGYALGAQGFSNMLLKTELIDIPLTEIKSMGEQDLSANLQRVKRACETIAPNQPLYDCVQSANSHKPAGGAVARGQEQLAELKAFVIDRDLLTIPSNEQALVAEAPPHRRSNLAYIRRPGPFDQAGLPSIYYIAPPDPTWTPEQQLAYVPGEAQLLFVSAHEVWPRHFLQGLHTRQHSRDTSRLIRSYANSEGWAHYIEQMMWDAGLRDDPVSEIGQLMGSLTRNVRYLSAVGLHTESMSVAQSEAMFLDKGLTSEGRAIRQAARGTYDPEYLKYTLGKILILRMRDRWMATYGEDSLKAFHDRFLSYGAAPLPLIEKYLFTQAGQHEGR